MMTIVEALNVAWHVRVNGLDERVRPDLIRGAFAAFELETRRLRETVELERTTVKALRDAAEFAKDWCERFNLPEPWRRLYYALALSSTAPVKRGAFSDDAVRELLAAAQPVSTVQGFYGTTAAEWTLRVLDAAQRVRESEAK